MAIKTENLTAAHKRLIAYAHPLREKIFTILTERSASPAEITRALNLPRKDLGNVDFHTKKLVELDCAELVDERPGRGSLREKVYKATERAMVETEEWDRLLRDNPAFAEYLLDRTMQVQLDDFVAARLGGTIGESDDFHMSRTHRVLDRQALLELLQLNEERRLKADDIELKAAERRREDGADAILVSDGLSLFKIPSSRARQ